MEHRRNGKRFISALLAFVMVLSLVSGSALTTQAAEIADGQIAPQPEHTEHTPECGYRAATEGAPCKYEALCDQKCTDTDGDGLTDHARSCAYTLALEKDLCDKECQDPDGDGLTDHAQDCAFTLAKGKHTHNASCGYREADAGAPCTLQGGEKENGSEGETTGSEGGTAVPETTAPETPAETAAKEKTQAQLVQELIDALPEADAVTAENAEDVKAQLTVIDEAKAELTDEEMDGLDISRYMAASAALSALDGADTPKTLETVSVTYLDAAGKTQTCSSATAVTADTTALSSGWYVVNSDVSVASRITVTGDVHLILADDCTLTASDGISVSGGNSLSIYAQSAGDQKGWLRAHATTQYVAGIGCDKDSSAGTVIINGGAVVGAGAYGGVGIGGNHGAGGTVIINGGNVYGFGGRSSAGICVSEGGTVTINGGSVTATGGPGIGATRGTITITGGAITATGEDGAPGIRVSKGDTITISGGTVKATGGESGAGIGGGLYEEGGIITIAGGTVTAKGGYNAAGIGGGDTGKCGTVTITGGTVEATAGTMCYNAIGTGAKCASYGTVTISPASGNIISVKAGSSAEDAKSLSNSPFTHGVNITESVRGKPYLKSTVDASAVMYLDADGSEKSCTQYKVITSDTIALSDGWYVVKGDVTVADRINVNGDVHLILTDGCTLTAEKGINVTGHTSSLSIYAQSTGDSKGTLTATGADNAAGIGVGGTVTINGGSVNSTGGSFGAGIGGGEGGSGGTVIINGGSVNATGGNNGAGIGGGRGGAGETITINGGTVYAKGNEWGAGIGGGASSAGGTITINGGTVTASGSNWGAGIGSGGVCRDAGNITINGGTVTANGVGYGAGIGGGYEGGGGLVAICGGTVEATAGEYCNNAVGDGFNSSKIHSLVILNPDQGISVQTGDSKETAQWLEGSPFKKDNIIDKVLGKKYVKTVVGVPPVPYLDADGSEKSCTEYKVITSDTTALSDGWYVVNGDVTIADRISVSGDVHLILADGSSLTANQGIKVSSGNGFTVYSQSMGADMGRLTAKPTGCNAGIGSNMNEGCGTVVINGGRIDAQAPASYGEPAGIGGGGYGAAGTVIINNGVVNATGCGKGIGGWGTSGTISIRGGIVTSNGIGTGGYGESHQTSISDNSVVISSGAINKANQGSWSGVVIEKGTGKVYGGTVTLPMDVTLPEGTTLTIPEGATLAAGTGVTLTNNGAIYMDGGALNAAVTGKIYYPLTVTNGMASPTSSLNGKTFAQAGGTVTLTADPAVGKTASWTCVSGDVTVTDNTFTMPSNAAAVEAVYVNAPAYTVTIPTEVTVGKTATVSVTAAVAEDYCLEVGIDNAEHRFVMTSEEGATLAYAVSDGSKQVNPGGSILLVEGGAEKNATATLDFRLTQDAQYAGSYKDTVIFTVSVKEKP